LKKKNIRFVCSKCGKTKLYFDFFGSILYYWMPRKFFVQIKFSELTGDFVGFFSYQKREYKINSHPDRTKRY